MYYLFPDYYNKFECSAESCEDTCCAGWDIVVDENSLNRYRKVRGSYGLKVLRSVNWAKKTFRKDKDRRCAFLRDDGLCDMYINLGPEQLCRTCRNYPRHIETYENIREVTLSVSCPEVARILMQRKEPVRFVSREDDLEEEVQEGFDPLMYSVLAECREELIKVLQNREMPLETRAAICYAICNDVQVKINNGELFDSGSIPEKYRSKNAVTYIQAEVDAFLSDTKEYFEVMRNAFLSLYRFETLYESWPEHVLRTETLLYNDGPEVYADHVKEFGEWKAQDEMWDIRMEQLLVYFISEYFCRAAYDTDVITKIHMALIPAAVIHELALAFWIRNNKKILFEDIVRIVYRFSREIEHSDINLDKFREIRFEGMHKGK